MTASYSLSEVLPTAAELERASARAAARVARLASANTRLNGTTVTETAANGAIRATVSMSGALLKVELPGAGARLSTLDAVTQLTACIQRAQARIAQRAAELMASELGDDPAVEEVLKTYRDRFPAPPEPRPGSATPPPMPPPPRAEPPRPGVETPRPAPRSNPGPPRRNRAADEDDWGSQSFMRPVV